MRILIGCPTYERYHYCIAEWLKAVKKIIENEKEHQIDYLLIDNSPTNHFFETLKKQGVLIEKSNFLEDVKKRIALARNLLREKAINEKYDFFLSLEQDLIPDENLLKNLLKHNKEIISAYYGKTMIFTVQDKETKEIKDIALEVPVIYIEEDNKIRNALPQEVLNKGLIEIGASGLGCILIKTNILKKIKFRTEKGKKAFDDMFFCEDVKKLKKKIFLDSDLKVYHMHTPWGKEMKEYKKE